jgi:serine/arginine repetitive matrix protein 2
MVPSPVPGRMQANGHAPMYNPPTMWVPVQPPAQNSNGMVRPMASPYPSPMMAYPANGAPAMYPAPMPAPMPGTPQSQNLQANRNRNVPVMSPVMQHAGASIYPASPAMMHMQMTPTSGYLPLPAGRGQPRAENGQMAIQQPNSGHPSTSHVGFSAVPHSPYMRNW